MTTKPILYLFIGYPGAGKTSIAKLIADETTAQHLWADHVRKQMFASPTYSAAENQQLYDVLNQQTEDLLHAGKSVIFDTAFNFRSDRERLYVIAEKTQATVVTIWVNTPRAIAAHRAVHDSYGKETRIYGNMSQQDFDRMADNLQEPTPEEQAIKVDGTDVDSQPPADLLALLHAPASN
jgi:predicted kinase